MITLKKGDPRLYKRSQRRKAYLQNPVYKKRCEMCGAKFLFTNAEIVPVGILRHMNNTPRNNIRLEIDELETLVGILNAYLDRQPAVVLDDEKLTKNIESFTMVVV